MHTLRMHRTAFLGGLGPLPRARAHREGHVRRVRRRVLAPAYLLGRTQGAPRAPAATQQRRACGRVGTAAAGTGAKQDALTLRACERRVAHFHQTVNHSQCLVRTLLIIFK